MYGNDETDYGRTGRVGGLVLLVWTGAMDNLKDEGVPGCEVRILVAVVNHRLNVYP